MLHQLSDEVLDTDAFRLDCLEEARLKPLDECFELDAYDPDEGLGVPPPVNQDELDATVESIRTYVWLMRLYEDRKAFQLARENAQAAFDLWRQYYDVLPDDHDHKVLLAADKYRVVGFARSLLPAHSVVA